MKRFFAVLLAFVMTFSLIGCGKEEIKSGFTLGEIAGDKYENAFLNTGYTLSPGWHYNSEDEIKNLNTGGVEMTEEEYKEFIKTSPQLYAMYATDENEANSVTISLEKIDEELLESFDYMEIALSQMDVMEEGFVSMGFEDFSYEVVDLENGVATKAIKASVDVGGFYMYMLIFGNRVEDYAVNMTITAFGEDITLALADDFYVLN